MPRSIFLGRPWPAPGEPLWLDDDRAWAYALTEVENELCPGGCGQRLEDSTRRGGEDDWDVHVYTCHACAAKQRRTDDSGVQGALVWVSRSLDRR